MFSTVLEYPPRPQSAAERSVRRRLLADRPAGRGFVLRLCGFVLKVTWGRAQA